MTPDWKKRLLYVREEYYKNKFPQLAKDHEIPAAKRYIDTNSNGLQRCIRDFLVYSGWDCQRHNVQGQMRKINGQMKWTKSASRRGGADQHAIIMGRHVSIETKIGKDTMSDHQHKEKERIERAGGLYVVATDMENFLKWFDQTFPNEFKNSSTTVSL